MSNAYFRFKQFIIYQDRCAMKVCTDACMLGAWFANKISAHSTILDIGSGTGLLMMMLAQKSKAAIQGIELDLPCFKQLEENISRSQWTERLKAFHGDVRTHSFAGKYDFIISNPPFFENDLPSQTEEEKSAKHSRDLSLHQLIQVIDRYLTKDGSFGILLPYHRCQYFNTESEKQNFYLQEKLLIRHSPAHDFSRVLLHYSRRKENVGAVLTMSITQNDGGGYTKEFIDLLKDYYLHL